MQRIYWLALATVVGGVWVLSTAVLSDLSAKDKDENEKDQIEKQMEQLHEGKRSPYRQLLAAAEQPMANWDLINSLGPRFVPLSRLLKQAKNQEIRDSADGYFDAVNNMGKAAAAKDWPKTRAAIADLKTSCGDCHFKGGVGGKLD